MDGAGTKPTRLVEHDAALSKLLKSLLAGVPGAGDEILEQASTPAGPGESASVQAADTRHTACAQPITESHDNAAPRPPLWATHDFRALLFRVGEYRFAMPLVMMQSVASLPAQRTRLPAPAAWHLGLIRYRQRSVALADLGLLIGVQARCAAARYVLVIGDGSGGVVCDQIDDAVLVRAGEVHWRRPSQDRAWLAGLLTQQMCVLLDVDALWVSIGHG